MILMNNLATLFGPHCYSANFVRVSMALYYEKILWLKPCPVKESLNKQLFTGNIHLILAGETVVNSVWS